MILHATEIGRVRKNNVTALIIKDKYWKGTFNLDRFSHIIVLWWITGHDNASSRETLQVTPPIEGAELSGVFATRSPLRPTPIGLSIVKILRIDNETHTIEIDQIDAFDETPIIDIKPYMPSSDRVERARVAPWFIDNVNRYS